MNKVFVLYIVSSWSRTRIFARRRHLRSSSRQQTAHNNETHNSQSFLAGSLRLLHSQFEAERPSLWSVAITRGEACRAHVEIARQQGSLEKECTQRATIPCYFLLDANMTESARSVEEMTTSTTIRESTTTSDDNEQPAEVTAKAGGSSQATEDEELSWTCSSANSISPDHPFFQQKRSGGGTSANTTSSSIAGKETEKSSTDESRVVVEQKDKQQSVVCDVDVRPNMITDVSQEYEVERVGGVSDPLDGMAQTERKDGVHIENASTKDKEENVQGSSALALGDESSNVAPLEGHDVINKSKATESLYPHQHEHILGLSLSPAANDLTSLPAKSSFFLPQPEDATETLLPSQNKGTASAPPWPSQAEQEQQLAQVMDLRHARMPSTIAEENLATLLDDEAKTPHFNQVTRDDGEVGQTSTNMLLSSSSPWSSCDNLQQFESSKPQRKLELTQLPTLKRTTAKLPSPSSTISSSSSADGLFIPHYWLTQFYARISQRLLPQHYHPFCAATWIGFWALLHVTCANYVLTPMRDAIALQVGVEHMPKLTLASTFLAFCSSVPIGWLFEAPDPNRRKMWKRMGLTRGETQGTSLALFYRCFAFCLLSYAVCFQWMEYLKKSSSTQGDQEGEAAWFFQLQSWWPWFPADFVWTFLSKGIYVAFFLVVHLMKLHSVSLVWGVTTEAMEYEEVARKKSHAENRKTRLQRMALVSFGGTMGGILGR